MSAIVAAFVALVVAWLTARLAAVRNHEDRLWSRRADAYSDLFGALQVMQDIHDDAMRNYLDQGQLNIEVETARWQRYRDSKDQFFVTAARVTWLVSPRSLGIVADLRRALAEEYDTYFEDLDAGSAALTKATSALSEQARKDLEGPGPTRLAG